MACTIRFMIAYAMAYTISFINANAFAFIWANCDISVYMTKCMGICKSLYMCIYLCTALACAKSGIMLNEINPLALLERKTIWKLLRLQISKAE